MELQFQKGIPTLLKIDGDSTYSTPLNILIALNEIGAKHGVGRIDIVENRFLGLKVQEKTLKSILSFYIKVIL